MASLKIAAILMASGHAKRFGSNKLLTEYQNRPLIETVFDNLPAERFFRVIVVTHYAPIAIAAAQRRFSIAEDNSSTDDTAQTIRLGITSLPMDTDACMFLVCDQPYLTSKTIGTLCEEFLKTPHQIIAPVCNNNRGNPVIFPKELFTELSILPSNKTGNFVINAHKELLRMIPFQNPKEFLDIDKPQDLTTTYFTQNKFSSTLVKTE